MEATKNFKEQFEITGYEGDNLVVKSHVNNRVLTVPRSKARIVKKMNNGEMIRNYLLDNPTSSVEEVLEGTGLANPIYVKKIMKTLK